MIERLWWRAGFGPRPRDLRGRRTHADLVHEFLHPRGATLEGPEPRVDGRPLNPANQYGHDVLWWLDRMVRGRHPLVERMTLNWHDHWATSNDKVGDVKLMMRQQRTLRRYALGNFRTLARAMVRDGAMQIWLDLAGSSDEAPNENFAREFFELFTLGREQRLHGEGHPRGRARPDGVHVRLRHEALRLRPQAARRRHEAHPRPARALRPARRRRPRAREPAPRRLPVHADLGLLLAPHPARRGCCKQLVAAYTQSGYEVAPVLSLILADGALYADLEEPDMIKPPVVYVAGMLRQTGTYITTDDWVWMLDQMGQRPFYPPNVSGWEQNEAWLSTSALRMRFQAAASLLHDAIEDGGIPATRTPQQALDHSPRIRRRALDEQGDEFRARVLQPAQRRRQGREVGDQALLARARARPPPGPARRARRAGLLMQRGCRDWHGTRGGAAPRRRAARADPRGGARRAGGVRARRARLFAARPARRRRRAAARGQRHAGPLDARRARGGRGPGRERARRSDPGLALPRRRQRRPQHARPARRPALRAAALAHRRRPRHSPAARRRAGLRLAPQPGRAAHALRRGQGGGAAGRRLRAPRPVALQLRRLLAQRHRRAGARPDAAGWGARST